MSARYLTGPEHYRAAQKLLGGNAGKTLPTEQAMYTAAVAQVHATLAMAAATALQAMIDTVEAGGSLSAGPGTWGDVLEGGAS